MDASQSNARDRNDAIRAGDHNALAAAFREHHHRLARIVQFRCDSRLVRRIDAEDVLQEAYLSATQRCSHLEGDSDESLFVWLRLITVQTLIDVHRRHLNVKARDAGRDVPLHRPTGDSASASLAAILAEAMTTPSLALQRVESVDRLRAALEQMSDTDREILALRHFEELANQEVAAVLGIEQKAASIRYIRALRRLQHILEELSSAGRNLRIDSPGV